jgi:hypothetical protein
MWSNMRKGKPVPIRRFEFQALADADAAVVQEGAAALAGGEHLVAQRVIDHRLIDLALVGEGNRDGVLREAVDEIGRAVERVDDPLVLAAERPPAVRPDSSARIPYSG